MIFVTGPLFAGKEAYICEHFQWNHEEFLRHGVRDVHLLAENTEDLDGLAEKLCEKEIVISTEIGGGVVPVDASQREAREKAGRLQCLLAKRADVVLRVCCGIPQFLKGSFADES